VIVAEHLVARIDGIAFLRIVGSHFPVGYVENLQRFGKCGRLGSRPAAPADAARQHGAGQEERKGVKRLPPAADLRGNRERTEMVVYRRPRQESILLEDLHRNSLVGTKVGCQSLRRKLLRPGE
jgi:hypothetical protein